MISCILEFWSSIFCWYAVAEYDIYYDKVDKYDADDDAQRIFLLYIDRSAKIVSAFSRNPHPNTITQLQETNPWIGTWTTLKIKFFLKFLYLCICTCQNDLISVRLLMAASFVIYKQLPFPANNSFISTRCIKTLSTDATLLSW